MEDFRKSRATPHTLHKSRGPQLVVRAYEILKSDEYNEDFRISKGYFQISAGISGFHKHLLGFLITGKNFARFQAKFCEISGFQAKF